MTIITRGALVFHGHRPPPEVAYVVSDHRGRRVVTWADVLRDRRGRQARRLEQKRHTEPWRAARLWVAYFDRTLFGGWQAFLDDTRGCTWIDRDAPNIREQVMALFPPPDLFPTWERWKPWFAGAFRRRTQDRRPVGVALLWRCGTELRLGVRRAEVRA